MLSQSNLNHSSSLNSASVGGVSSDWLLYLLSCLHTFVSKPTTSDYSDYQWLPVETPNAASLSHGGLQGQHGTLNCAMDYCRKCCSSHFHRWEKMKELIKTDGQSLLLHNWDCRYDQFYCDFSALLVFETYIEWGDFFDSKLDSIFLSSQLTDFCDLQMFWINCQTSYMYLIWWLSGCLFLLKFGLCTAQLISSYERCYQISEA